MVKLKVCFNIFKVNNCNYIFIWIILLNNFNEKNIFKEIVFYILFFSFKNTIILSIKQKNGFFELKNRFFTIYCLFLNNFCKVCTYSPSKLFVKIGGIIFNCCFPPSVASHKNVVEFLFSFG